jgi:hypothetical protein
MRPSHLPEDSVVAARISKIYLIYEWQSRTYASSDAEADRTPGKTRLVRSAAPLIASLHDMPVTE